MLVYSISAIAFFMGGLAIAVRIGVKAAPAIEKYLRRRAVRRANLNRHSQ